MSDLYRHLSKLSGGFALFFLLFSLSAQAQKGGRLEVFLAIKEGRLVVDTSTFKSDSLSYPATTQTELVGLLNRSFAELDSLVGAKATQWCFPNSICKPLDATFMEGYRYLTMRDGKGRMVATNFDDEAMMDGYELSLQDFFELYIFDILVSNVWALTPLSIDPEQLGPRNYFKLQFPFSVKPPIAVDEFTIIWDERDTLSRNKTRSILNGLNGQLWYRDHIEERVKQYFFLSKFQLNYYIDHSTISVDPNRLARVVVKTNREKEVKRAFYQLLPTPLFKDLVNMPLEQLLMDTSGVGMAGYQFNLLEHENYRYQNLPKLQTDLLQLSQMQLGKLNYSIRAINTPNGLLDSVPITRQGYFYDIFANKIAQESPPDTSNVPPQPLPVNSDGVIAGDDFANNPRTFDNNRLRELDQQHPTKQRRNFLGFGIDHSFGDGTATRLVYQRLTENGSTISVQAGYAFNENGIDEGGFFVSGNFFTDYLFFDQLKKKLSLQITGNSLLTANRVFTGTETKVRRTGAKTKFQLEWFRDLRGQKLSSSLSLNHEWVDQEDFLGNDLGNIRIAFVDISSGYFFKKPGNQQDAILQIQPEIRLGLSGLDSDGDPTSYLTSNIQLHWTQSMAKGFGLKLNAYWLHGSNQTPIFEQPALKTTMNRGFKEDDIIASNLLGGQLECWIPFPRFGNPWSGFNKYLYENIRLAVFTDATHFTDHPTLTNDFLWSPGAGIRFIRFPAQVNFDWAYGIAPSGLNIGKSRFSIGLILNGPL